MSLGNPPPRDAGNGLPKGFSGGTPELWDETYHDCSAGRPLVGSRSSAPERAIVGALLGRCKPTPGECVLELGCGGSRWLPLLASRAGVRVAGVDFSDRGVARSRQLLREVGADDSAIVQGTIEDYVSRNGRGFDIVVSFGLIEHFSDLHDVIHSHLRCLRPGGRLFMSAPNLSGPNLTWARTVAPDLFEWHRPISGREVAAVCLKYGCTDVGIAYLGGLRLFAPPSAACRGHRFVRPSATWARRLFNGTGELGHRIEPNSSSRIASKRLSPYFAVSARIPN